MTSSSLMSAASLGLDASSQDSPSSAERLFFASSSSPPLQPSYRTPPQVPDGPSRRRPENKPSHTLAFTSQSSPASNRRFGSPIRLPHPTTKTTPPRRSRLRDNRSSATPPTRESQLRARLGAATSAAPLLGLADPVTIVDDRDDAFGGALFGWAGVTRPMMGKAAPGLRGSALGELDVLGDGILRSRSTPPRSQQHKGTPPSRPRRPSVASSLVTPPARVFAQTSMRGASGLGLGLGFELDVEQDSPDKESSNVGGSTVRRQSPLTRSSSTNSATSFEAPAPSLAPCPPGLVSTPPKRKTANRTSSTESGGGASSSKPAPKSPKKSSGTRASDARSSTTALAPAFDDGKQPRSARLEPTGETMFGAGVCRAASTSQPATRSSARLKARANAEPATSRASGSASNTAQRQPSRNKAKTTTTTSKAKPSPKAAQQKRSSRPAPPGLGICLAVDAVMASPGSTCSAPSLDGSPASTSSVPSIVITPPAALSLADASRSAFLAQLPLPASPSPQQRYTGTVLRYEDGSTAGFNVSPPLASAAPDQFASPAIGTVSPTQSDASFSPEQTPSLEASSSFPTAITWFDGQDNESSADVRAWATAAKNMDTDLLGFLEAANDDEARVKTDDFLASMRFSLTLARNTCPTAPGGANSKDNQTPFDCCRWVRGAARAYLSAEPPFAEGKMEQRDLLDAALAKQMEHIVTGVRALMADSLEGKTPPHETPLWLAELCAAIVTELRKMDDTFAALPLHTSSPKRSETEAVPESMDTDVVVQSMGHLLLGSPAKLKGESSSLDTTPRPDSRANSAPRKKPSVLFLDALSFELDSALSYGVAVREQALHLAVPIPVKKTKRRSSSAKNGRSRRGATQAEIDAELEAQKPPSDLSLASKGEISAEELRSRERRRAAVGHAKDSFTTLNTVRFVGELYRLDVLPLAKLQAWLERLIVDTVYPGVPSAFELEAACALILTVGPILEQQAQRGGSALKSPEEVASEQEAPQTPASKTATTWTKLTTPGSSESSAAAGIMHASKPLSALKTTTTTVTATPRSDGAPANHWIRCSPSAARLRARSSITSLQQGEQQQQEVASEGNAPRSPAQTSDSNMHSPTFPALLPGDTSNLSIAAHSTLHSATLRLTHVLDVAEVSEEGKMWIRGVLGFRLAGWKRMDTLSVAEEVREEVDEREREEVEQEVLAMQE